MDCTCGNTANATSNTCADESCNSQWITMVTLRTISSVLTASMIVGHTVLNLYASHYTERPYVLAIETSLIGFIAYGPVRAIFLALTSNLILSLLLIRKYNNIFIFRHCVQISK